MKNRQLAERWFRRQKKRGIERMRKIAVGEIKPRPLLPAHLRKGMPSQVKTIARLIHKGKKVVNHGGQQAFVDGKRFVAKHVKIATHWLWMIRRERKRGLSAHDVRQERAPT